MIQYWHNVVARIDAMSLRERCLVFLVAVALLVALLQTILLDPLFNKQKILSQRIAEQNNKIAGIDAEIIGKLRSYDVDPDRASRDRLETLQNELRQLSVSLSIVEKSVVTPDKMAILLESILKANGRLQLLSLKTVVPNNAAIAKLQAAQSGTTALIPAMVPTIPAVPAVPVPPKARSSLIYRHGVEIVVRGQYGDLVIYLKALESMQGKIFWVDAKLNVESYPNSVLTFSVYTISLDRQWMKL
jgi:MSHA biogenesis protein MshJ